MTSSQPEGTGPHLEDDDQALDRSTAERVADLATEGEFAPSGDLAPGHRPRGPEYLAIDGDDQFGRGADGSSEERMKHRHDLGSTSPAGDRDNAYQE